MLRLAQINVTDYPACLYWQKFLCLLGSFIHKVSLLRKLTPGRKKQQPKPLKLLHFTAFSSGQPAPPSCLMGQKSTVPKIQLGSLADMQFDGNFRNFPGRLIFFLKLFPCSTLPMTRPSQTEVSARLRISCLPSLRTILDSPGCQELKLLLKNPFLPST